ncbi:hypothetical protein B0H17DRAFT_941295 [Mycena rosella]|uniref:Uncharacterized protein n=1 Tax=Mycena rosella TaxID=1033263 RepID=A0AAD7D957_MYCRO|nr:hypothetical protein B0H17DRAFT_941295 [Mycena rosella]
MSKIAGVLKTLSDAAEAANVPLTGLPAPSAPLVPALPASSSGSVPRLESAPKKSKRRGALDPTLPSASSGPPTRSDHEHLLATKWMGPTKLAELVRSEGLVYKKGKFTAVEIKLINDAVENYRTTRGLTEDDMQGIIWPHNEKQKDATFWSEITSALVGRPICAVYHYMRRANHPMKQQGKWHPEEDARLIQAVTSLGQQWEKVAGLVGRMATDCRDRYRNHIVDREKRNSGSWFLPEEEELTRIITEMRKGQSLDTDVFWGKVTELMGGKRSRQQCRIKWTDSLSKRYQNEGQIPRWSARDAFVLVQKIDAQKVTHETEIAWKSIPDPQWNSWSAHILSRRWFNMKKSIKGFEDMSHAEIMDIMRFRYAEMPHVKVVKSATFVADSDDNEPHPGSSTGPGTLAVQSRADKDDDSE